MGLFTIIQLITTSLMTLFILGGDARRLQDGHAEGEGAAQAEVVQGGVQGPVQGGFLGAVQEALRGHCCWEPRAEGHGGTRRG